MSKSVALPTQKYNEYSEKWQKCRDAIAGHDAVNGKGTVYLPKLSGQQKDDYEKYRKQALFYNATGRTFGSYEGLIFRKDPVINADLIADFVEDCTLSGTSLEDFAKRAVKEELTTSRFGVLVDYPTVKEGANMSQSEAERKGIRPFLVAYKAEDIIGDPQMMKIGGRNVLGKIRLKESYVEADPEDEFKHEEKERIRVLDLVPSGSQMIYRQRVFKPEKKDSAEWVEDPSERWFPKIAGKPITQIPFFMTGGYAYREPHLIDLVNINLSHYVAYADHRKGVSWTTRPQPYGTGITDEDIMGELVLGGGTLWKFRSGDANIGMLEYSGKGLGASENLLENLEHMMAHIGAQLLMPENQADKTATEFVIKKQGENSALGNVSNLVSSCLTDAIRFAGKWSGVTDTEDINISLNTDFVPFQATPDDLIKMIGAVQTGKYSTEDYLWWLEQSEIIDPTVSNEERKAQMQTSVPEEM